MSTPSPLETSLPDYRQISPEQFARRLLALYPTEEIEEALGISHPSTQQGQWEPLPGPQTEAYNTSADELFYGGAAGGGKSFLLLGLAATAHYKSIIFRRQYPQLAELVDQSRLLFSAGARYNDNKNLWRFDDGRSLEFGAVQHLHDWRKFQGRPHDLVAFDELPNFLEAQYLALTGWARTTRQGQRVRIVGTGNPPTTTEGEWVIRRWAAWLDRQHSRPAKPGELRWYASIEGKDTEVEGPETFEHKGETIIPRSRTFIAARLSDNPYLVETGYGAVLQGLPEPLRSQLLYGDMGIGIDDDPWQVIPTEWVRLAQERWVPEGRLCYVATKSLESMTAVGVDVARGGSAQTVLARRYGTWYAELEAHPGKATPDGPSGAALVLQALTEGGVANIDVIGVGASVYDSVMGQGGNAMPINFSERTVTPDRTGTLHFLNMRAYAYWSLREALDPMKGDNLALPPDSELLADLTAARWFMRTGGIQIEEKEEIVKRLGRSPDKGDAVVLASLPYMGIRVS